MKGQKTDFDAIVVGSGPGGATVAKDLTAKGKKVLILEWGDNDPKKGSFLKTIPRAFVPGKSVVMTNQALPVVRAITTGGSTMIFCGTAFDPPIEMFKSYGVDISAEAEEMKNDLPIAPLPDELMNVGPQVFLESAGDLGYDVHKLNKFIDSSKCKKECQLCMYGCPFGAKWDARSFVEQAMENGAELITRAKVQKVLIEDGKAVGVEYKHHQGRQRAYAPKIIVAAGGIGSPLILRQSGIKKAGYNFFFDPLVFVYGKIKGLGNGKAVPMSAGIHFEEDGIVLTDFNLPQMMKIAFDLEILKVKQAFSYADTLPIMVKVRDDLAGSVSNNGWVNKRLTKADKQKLDKGSEHAKRILTNAGATDIYRSYKIAAHPGGTVKIGDLVDTNLKTEFDNLYVCDCSVMPQEWGLPPTTSIIALGKRLAKHLLAADPASKKQDRIEAVA
ncbi:MAG: GMC family oxidoreductase [Deltaproteobacteria bacterium]|nr:GMC family oxidoreductase [Deltaproteobacteria bacterium]MBT4638673.1 GMC family oxidoreductase [Deltaproteobacteria bacterium]MBT6504467.1 GMC family oxidoreductase [Deltaproteobacteria bacterium]MBT6615202.1 GMC family oxidoreductase [Deltaproteobacteria bacterium]MBT7713602.1 GMC family oxidoreductase [Deltaproteobacteria bacterium]